MNSSALLSAREFETLRLLVQFRFLTRSHIQSFLFDDHPSIKLLSAQTMTFRILNSLQARQLIARTLRPVGGSNGGSGSFAYFPTSSGELALGKGRLPGLRRSAPRGAFLLRHSLATADVAECFYRCARDHPGHELIEWRSDWESAQRLGSSLVVPDAFVVYASDRYELHAFVEVDLGTGGSKYFATKIERYLDLYRSELWRTTIGLWPSVLIVAPTPTRVEFLRRVTEQVIDRQPDRSALRNGTEFLFSDLPTLQSSGLLV